MQHDIAGNYFRAEKAGEHKMKKDILLSEIAKMVALCPVCVIKLLNDSGIKTEAGISNSALVKKVSNAINKNMLFTKALIIEILSKNKSANGVAGKVHAKSLVFGTGFLFGANGNNANKDMAEADLLNKTKLIRDVNGINSGIGKYIGWGLFFATVGGIVYYCYKR